MLYYCNPVTSGVWIWRKIFCKFFLLHALGTSFLLNFWNETYVHYWEFIVPLFLVVTLLNFD